MMETVQGAPGQGASLKCKDAHQGEEVAHRAEGAKASMAQKSVIPHADAELSGQKEQRCGRIQAGPAESPRTQQGHQMENQQARELADVNAYVRARVT
jgi:hypothetical protein